MYALGVGTTRIAPPPGVIQSLPSSSRCPLAILLLVVSLLHWSRFPLTVDFPLAAEVAMVPPPVLGGGSIPLRLRWALLSFRVAVVVQGSRLNGTK